MVELTPWSVAQVAPAVREGLAPGGQPTLGVLALPLQVAPRKQVELWLQEDPQTQGALPLQVAP